jgi:hypothetical protein
MYSFSSAYVFNMGMKNGNRIINDQDSLCTKKTIDRVPPASTI